MGSVTISVDIGLQTKPWSSLLVSSKNAKTRYVLVPNFLLSFFLNLISLHNYRATVLSVCLKVPVFNRHTAFLLLL